MSDDDRFKSNPDRDSASGSDTLSLYYFKPCPYCFRVLRALKKLGVEFEKRDIHADPRYQADLIAARGRKTVPVLRINSSDGEERWLPESRDIVRYLKSTYG